MDKKKIFLTPGPTQLLPEVRTYIDDALNDNICSINHRSEAFMEIFRYTVKSLRQLMNIPEDMHVFFLNSATECMDRIIQNCSAERTFHFVNGAFAERFYKTSLELERRAEKIEVPYGEGFDLTDLNINNEPELICITQNETSTGVAIDPMNIYKIKEEFNDAILAVDIVTSAPYVDLDLTRIDTAFFSVQKGFGLPAGLGVLILNDTCLNKASELKHEGHNIGSYHNFISLYENALKDQTTETPNVLGIYLLGRVCEHFKNYSIQQVRKDTEEKAEMLYSFLESSNILKPFVKDPSARSKTVIVADAGKDQAALKQKLADKGLIVGSGYGKLKDIQIRIANFPVHTIGDIKEVINTLSE